MTSPRGAGDAPQWSVQNVVLVHGAYADGSSWSAVVERLHARNNPVCYVIEERSAVDLAVLQDACVRLKLSRPRKRLIETARDLRSFFYLSQPRGFWDERLDRRPPAR